MLTTGVSSGGGTSPSPPGGTSPLGDVGLAVVDGDAEPVGVGLALELSDGLAEGLVDASAPMGGSVGGISSSAFGLLCGALGETETLLN